MYLTENEQCEIICGLNGLIKSCEREVLRLRLEGSRVEMRKRIEALKRLQDRFKEAISTVVPK